MGVDWSNFEKKIKGIQGGVGVFPSVFQAEKLEKCIHFAIGACLLVVKPAS